MQNILLLTKSLISEQALEQQLQQLDFEVYATKCVMESALYGNDDLSLLHNFEIILVSETISNSELSRLLPVIKDTGAVIVRKTDSILSEEEKTDWKNQGVIGWIRTKTSLEELRESLDDVMPARSTMNRTSNIIAMKRTKEKRTFDTLALTHKERMLLTLLFQANRSTISREELSLKLWNQESCNSTMTQLSTLVHRVKIKLADQGIYGDIVQTVWGVGYKLVDDFYQQVTLDDEYISEM